MVKNLPINAGDIRDSDLIPALGKSPGEGHDNPLQYSYLENPMDRGVWQAVVPGVTKSWTRLKWLSTQAHIGLLLLKVFHSHPHPCLQHHLALKATFLVLNFPNFSFWFCVVSTFLFIDWTDSGDLHALLPCPPWLYPPGSISDFWQSWGCPLRTDSLYPKRIHHLLYHSGPSLLRFLCLHL